jgi:hypothetical protein
LARNKVYFRTIQNTKEDFAEIRADASSLIVKLHSDLNHEDRAVITSADYARLLGNDGRYFRERLRSIFEMFDVLIVGHSLNDPDLRLILQIAKETANPEHPVFMTIAGATRAEQLELLEQFNIVALSYDNSDGRHAQLRRLLSLTDKFVIPRNKRLDLRSVEYSAGELEAAQSLALYRRLTAAAESDIRPLEYLGPLILQALRNTDEAVPPEELMRRSPLSSAVTTDAVAALVPSALFDLAKLGVLESLGSGFRLTPVGLTQAQDIHRQRANEEDEAYGQFQIEIRSKYPTITDEQVVQSKDMLRDTLVRVFKRRGSSIANAIFAGRSLDHESLGDVFHAVTSVASTISDKNLALAFVESAQVFLLEPSKSQKQYLASVSQGYFLYHLFGLDPECAKVRRDVFEHTIWWCDSNVILPLLAFGCASYEYALDLFTRLQKLGAFTLTTRRLIREVVEHLAWVARLLDRNSLDSPAVLAAAMQKVSYKQNLFLDGYIRLSAEGRVNKFADYLKTAVPYGQSEDGIIKSLESRGIRVLNVEEIEGFKAEDTREIFELTYEIREMRTNTATLRSDLQIDAEAEILQLIRKLKSGEYKPPVAGMAFETSYFLSQSRILDRIPPAEAISWTPEALYRYMTALPGQNSDAESLQRCMLQEYFGAGITVIDRQRYEKFFEPTIGLARATYRDERDKYIELVQSTPSGLDAEFEATPDLEKPFFVQQMGWKVAARERARADAAIKVAESATIKAEAADMELAKVKRERDTDAKRRKLARERQLVAESKNAADPKHIRKRDRQAKRRAKRRKR